MVEQAASSIARILIDGPEGNLLNPEVMGGLCEQLRQANEDENISGILLTGAGDHFCGGLDLGGIRAGGDPVEYAASLAELLKLMAALHKPIAVAVNGDALASGGSIVAASDYAVSLADVKIGSYEVAVGVWPMVAQVPLIKRLGARLAMENIGSGEPFTAQRSLEVGLINEISDAGELEAKAMAWLQLAARGGSANAGRAFFYEIADLSYNEALDLTLQKFAAQF